jgi:hypothetical protein
MADLAGVFGEAVEHPRPRDKDAADKKSAAIRKAFEPAILNEHYAREIDDKVRHVDRPERLQVRYLIAYVVKCTIGCIRLDWSRGPG